MQKRVNDLILPPGRVASQPTFDASLNYAKRTVGLSPLAEPYKVSGVEQDIFLQFSFNTNHVLCSCTAAAPGCWLW